MEYLTDDEIVAIVKISKPTLWRWRKAGTFPMPRKVGKNTNRTLVSEFKSAGNYEIHFDAEDLTNGIYFYRLGADNFNLTRKIILLK